jgi:hypothetical protein
MITFGSAWIYEREGQVVANCHKLPQENFVRRMLTVDDIVAMWRPLLEELRTCYPNLHVLFTVSPIRHMGDGMHGNQLSKSTLLLAVFWSLSVLQDGENLEVHTHFLSVSWDQCDPRALMLFKDAKTGYWLVWLLYTSQVSFLYSSISLGKEAVSSLGAFRCYLEIHPWSPC